MMAPARVRLLDFVRDLAEGAKMLDMPDITSCRRCRGSRMARRHVRGPPIVVTFGRYCGSLA